VGNVCPLTVAVSIVLLRYVVDGIIFLNWC